MAVIDFEVVRARHRPGAVARDGGLVVTETGRVNVCWPLPAHNDQRPSHGWAAEAVLFNP
ncbi:MAG: hypothetical protein ACRDVW_11830 [Acidimicrobiales bacterium]